MKATAIRKTLIFTEENKEGEVVTHINPVNFDQSEVFSWSVRLHEEDHDLEGEGIIELITKTGVVLEVAYDEEVLSGLAREFRNRGVL